MAKATKRREEYTVTLELSRIEAQAIARVCTLVGGLPVSTWRKHTDAVSNALSEVDVCCFGDEDGWEYRGDILAVGNPV